MTTALLWYAVVTGALATVLLVIMTGQALAARLRRPARALVEPFPAEPQLQSALESVA